MLGFGLVVGGTAAVQWKELGHIALSWLISPLLSGLVSYLLFSFLQKKILFSFSPLRGAKKIAPFLVFATLFVFAMSTFLGGLADMHIALTFTQVLAISSLTGLFGFVIAYVLLSKIHKTSRINPHAALKQEAQLYSLGKIQKHLARLSIHTSDDHRDEIMRLHRFAETMTTEIKTLGNWDSHLTYDYQMVERIFGILQILSACFIAFAHGANDVANAIGPVSAVFELLKNPTLLLRQTLISPWLLAFGGLGVVFGLATYGWRVIETIGKNITQLTPTRGFSAEFAAATTILVASKLGLPISTTHSIVGAVLGVGLAKGLSALNLRLVRDIFLSWIITIPSSAICSVLLFFLLKFLFS